MLTDVEVLEVLTLRVGDTVLWVAVDLWVVELSVFTAEERWVAVVVVELCLAGV